MKNSMKGQCFVSVSNSILTPSNYKTTREAVKNVHTRRLSCKKKPIYLLPLIQVCGTSWYNLSSLFSVCIVASSHLDLRVVASSPDDSCKCVTDDSASHTIWSQHLSWGNYFSSLDTRCRQCHGQHSWMGDGELCSTQLSFSMKQ